VSSDRSLATILDLSMSPDDCLLSFRVHVVRVRPPKGDNASTYLMPRPCNMLAFSYPSTILPQNTARGVALLMMSRGRAYVIAQRACGNCNRPTWIVASSRIAPSSRLHPYPPRPYWFPFTSLWLFCVQRQTKYRPLCHVIKGV
jgi:hypothetical protein